MASPKNAKQQSNQAPDGADHEKVEEGIGQESAGQESGEQPQAAGSEEGGADEMVVVAFGKRNAGTASDEIVIGGKSYREGDQAPTSLLDSDANLDASGKKYLVRKGSN